MGEKTDEENGVQLKVPVVATVNQILHENGRIEYVIVPPDNEQDQGKLNKMKKSNLLMLHLLEI